MAEEVAAPSPQQPIELSSVQSPPPVESPVTLQQQHPLAPEKQSNDCPVEKPSAEVPIGHDADGSQIHAGDLEGASEKQALQYPSTQLIPEKVEHPMQAEATPPSEIVAALEAVNSSAGEPEVLTTLATVGSAPYEPVPSGFRRGEIDTAAPFESVKEAVSMFGARVDWKPQLRTASMERRITSETDLHKVQEDLAYYKEQVALTHASIANVVLELEKTKEQIQTLTRGPEDGQIMECRVASPQFAKSAEQQQEEDVEVEKEKYGIAISESQMVQREMASVKEELLALKDSKQVALRESQEAMTALDLILKRVEELTAEQASINEALVPAQAALVEAEEQLHMLRLDKEAESPSKPRDDSQEASQAWHGKAADMKEAESPGKRRDDSKVSSQFGQGNPADIKELESKLEETSAMVDKLKEELNGLKEAERKAALSATESQDAAEKFKLELEEIKSTEMEAVAGLGRVAEELDQVVANVSKAREEEISLASAVQVLKSEVESGHVELESMHEKEQTACATLASLQDELCKVRESLVLAQAGEAKARDAKETLPTAIKKAAAEADEAKAAAEASKEDVRKAKHETEQAKAATSTAVSRLQAALRESEAARASESMALAEFNAITESETNVADLESESEKGAGVTITLEEYSSLKKAAKEAEDVANKKVTAAFAQVEAAKASQREAQEKLDLSVKEAEGSREDMQKAQKKADEAQEAKLAAEGELRKWRAEHEQRRKSVSTPLSIKMATDQSPQMKVSNGEGIVKSVPREKGLVFQERKVAGLDSLAQVLSLKVPPPEKPGKFVSVENITKEKEKIKKKTLLTRVASFVVGKKGQTLNK